MPRQPQTCIGEVFGRLTVTASAPRSPTGRARWVARRECGSVVEVLDRHLRYGNTKSCGCLRREKAGLRATARAANRRGPISAWSFNRYDEAEFFAP